MSRLALSPGRRGAGISAGIPPRLLAALTRAGEPGRILAPLVDLGTALGPAEVMRQYRGARRNVVEATGDVYREVWSRAAAELGAEVIDLGHSLLGIKLGHVVTLTWVHEVQLDDVVVLRLAADKPVVHRLLTGAGIPVPAHVEVAATDLDAALPFLQTAPAGCVVKPAADTGVGAAVTGGIRDQRDLQRAAARVSRFGSRVLVEHFLPGRMYRVNILDGEVLGIVWRRVPTVVGDGRHTVAELVAIENDRRLADGREFGTNWLRVDLDCLLSLADQDLTLSSVPAAGSSAEWGGAPIADCAGGRSGGFLRRTGQQADIDFVLAHDDDLDAVFRLVDGEVRAVPISGRLAVSGAA
jgi:hypothetical protein